MRSIAPCRFVDPSPLSSGMERKNLRLWRSQTGCSAPLVASTPWALSKIMAVWTVRPPVFFSTLMKVPDGGVAALLITSRRPWSSASSSAGLSPTLVVTALTVLGGLDLRSKVSTRLGASVTNNHGKAATTPLGPEQSLAPAGRDTRREAGKRRVAVVRSDLRDRSC